MKHQIQLISILILLLFSVCCQSKNNHSSKIQTYQTQNVWEHDMQYFSFSKNEGYTQKPLNWDLGFKLNCISLELAEGTCIYADMCVDPIAIGHKSTSIAMIENTTLDKVNEIPYQFEKDEKAHAVIGGEWIDDSHKIKPHTYTLKSCKGDMYAFEIIDYEYSFLNHQLSNISIKSKNLTTNSSVQTTIFDEAYSNPIYFSFDNGLVASSDIWELKLDEYNFWLGGGVSAYIQENTPIHSAQLVDDIKFNLSDSPAKFITQNWYTYDHVSKEYAYNNNVYVVKTRDGKYPAFQFIDYYDGEGNKGYITINWKYLKP
jgi:hypothetical protein